MECGHPGARKDFGNCVRPSAGNGFAEGEGVLRRRLGTKTGDGAEWKRGGGDVPGEWEPVGGIEQRVSGNEGIVFGRSRIRDGRFARVGEVLDSPGRGDWRDSELAGWDALR